MPAVLLVSDHVRFVALAPARQVVHVCPNLKEIQQSLKCRSVHFFTPMRPSSTSYWIGEGRLVVETRALGRSPVVLGPGSRAEHSRTGSRVKDL